MAKAAIVCSFVDHCIVSIRLIWTMRPPVDGDETVVLVYPRSGNDSALVSRGELEGLKPGRWWKDGLVDFAVKYLQFNADEKVVTRLVFARFLVCIILTFDYDAVRKPQFMLWVPFGGNGTSH